MAEFYLQGSGLYLVSSVAAILPGCRDRAVTLLLGYLQAWKAVAVTCKQYLGLSYYAGMEGATPPPILGCKQHICNLAIGVCFDRTVLAAFPVEVCRIKVAKDVPHRGDNHQSTLDYLQKAHDCALPES